VFIVEGDRGEVLLPAIEQVVKWIDVEENRMLVELMEGLI
jgi:ribosomal 30S subunit maturation factor RimM